MPLGEKVSLINFDTSVIKQLSIIDLNLKTKVAMRGTVLDLKQKK